MTLDEMKKENGNKYYQQIDRAVEKKMPWQDMEVVGWTLNTYTQLQLDLQARDVEQYDIETLEDLVEILKLEVNAYDGRY